MSVTERSEHWQRHDERVYYFCGARCKARFTADPGQFISPNPAYREDVPAAAGAFYTCPMHPEVRQDHPGDCPKCGMTLEPELPDLDQEIGRAHV